MKAFVTGGTGHVGSTLVEVLVNQGHEVHCLVRETSDLTFLKSLNTDKLFFVMGDLTSLESILNGMDEAQPDYVFHSAAFVYHWGAWKFFYDMNIQGTRNIVDAIDKTSSVKKLIHVSTYAVYGYENHRDITEDQPYGKLHDNYSKSKIMVEKELWEKYNEGKGLPLTMIRPPSVLGPHDRYNFSELLGLIKSNRNLLPGKGDQVSSWAYTYDIAGLMLRMAEDDRATGEAFNVKNGDITAKDLLMKLLEILDRTDQKPMKIPIFLVNLVGGLGSLYGKLFRKKNAPLIHRAVTKLVTHHHSCNIDKAKRLLDWTPEFSLDVAIQKTVDWFLESGAYDAL